MQMAWPQEDAALKVEVEAEAFATVCVFIGVHIERPCLVASMEH